MTKKFLALTMVLVLAAGFAAVAAEHEDDRALTGTWNNELILDPGADDTFAGYSSVLSVDYTTGGISYSSETSLNLTGMTKQEFAVDSSVGLLDLSSTLNMDVNNANLRYWETSASLTLGGVSMSSMFYLQKHDWAYADDGSYEATFWPEYTATTVGPDFETPTVQTDSYVVPWEEGSIEYAGSSTNDFHDYGSGLELTFSGETPGGVSIDVTNTFGMMPTSDVETDLEDMLTDEVNSFIEGEFADVSSFSSDWADEVSGQEVIDEMVEGVPAMSVSGHDFSTYSLEEVVVMAWLAGQVDAPAVDTLDIGGTDYDGSAGTDVVTISELAVDFLAYVEDKEEGSLYTIDDPEFSVSGEVRDAYTSALKGSISIYGIAGDTGKVVNTEFDLGGAQYNWSITAADSSDSTDASVSFSLSDVDVGPDGTYGGSSLQYYSTLIELDNLSIGCCDFSNDTKFTEHNGFEYTEFDFSMAMETFPIDVDATLKWDEDPDTSDDGKVVTLTPSLSTDWSCFDLYTTLGSADGDIDSLSIDGFGISAELGHVKVTSVTALGSDDLTDLSTSGSYHGFDEVLRVDKLESAGDLDFTLDYYTNLGSSGSGLMPVALEGSASYPISSQFDIGTNLAWVDYSTYSGLQEVGLTFDYTF